MRSNIIKSGKFSEHDVGLEMISVQVNKKLVINTAMNGASHVTWKYGYTSDTVSKRCTGQHSLGDDDHVS